MLKIVPLLMAVMVASGCGSTAGPLSASRPQTASGVQAKSLTGDLLKHLGPIAARKGVQTAMKLALRNDGKAVKEWEDGVSQAAGPVQLEFQAKRLKSLQRALMAADVALMKLEGVSSVREALATAQTDDKKRAGGFEALKKAPEAEQAAYTKTSADALAAGFATAAASF